MLVQPQVQVVVEVLFGPQHSRQRLAHDIGTVGVAANLGRRDRRVERIGVAEASREHRVEVSERQVRFPGRACRQPQPDDLRLPRTDADLVVGRRLRSLLRRIHRAHFALDDETVDAVLHVGRGVVRTEKPRAVRLVLGEQQRHVGVAVQKMIGQCSLGRSHGAVSADHRVAGEHGLRERRLRSVAAR